MTNPIAQLRAELNVRFPERKDVIDGCLCAILAGEHVLLLGPPGTAKSALARAVAQAFQCKYFETLLTRFTMPEDLWGPISLAALEQDRFLRVTTGKLPEAQVAFLDEIFKCSSAALNMILTLLNERIFHNDGVAVPAPLISVFAASNELPEGKETEALFDRLMLRFDVSYLIQPNNLRQVLLAPEPVSSVKLTLADLKKAQADAARVRITDVTVDALLAIRDACRAEGIIASDRRWKKSLKLVQAAAHMAGEKQTSPEDLAVLVDSLWREPRDRSKVARIVGRLADPVSTQAQEILDAARETSQKVAGMKSGDRKAYIGQAAQTIDQFTAQQEKLAELARSGGRRAKSVIADASSEIQQMHAEMARAVSAGLGLRALR